ncbi:hypothetical protein Btru_027826, partial [Bulinus truncatus]
SKYVLVDQMATWYDAKSKCEKYGLGFAKVTSQSDQELIQKIQLKNQGLFWIGLRQNGSWADSTPVQYENWAHGFPDYQVSNVCARVIIEDATWETFNCSSKHQFLCQVVVFHVPNVVTTETKVKGLLVGVCLVGGLVLLMCLGLQMTCCRIRRLDTAKDNADKTPIV